MNGVGREGRGESVWLAFFNVLVYEDMARLSESLGEDGMIYREKQRARMDAIREQGYDGAWYRRGYYDDGTPLGSAQREDCRIDAIAQAFAGIAAETLAFEMERAVSSMRSAEKYLFDRRHRMFRLLTPPFEKDEQSPGYIKGYVAGIRENGGQYTHAAVWAALGFFGCHMNDIGAELLFAINPARRARDAVTEENYRIEPYVFAGDVYANPSHMGRGGWSWYTGSAAWYRRAVIEWLCGYRETKDGFTLTPRFSDRFASFSLDIRKKETCYHIEVCKGKRKTVVIDGKSIDSCDHFSFDGGTHTVCIFLTDF
jgi:cyclic beta-1,2-glucan synthetase